MSDAQAALIARDVCLGTRVDVAEFSIKKGQCVVLCGPNGSGKSSLLRLLAGLERPQRGSITLDERPLSAWTRLELASKIAWLPQRPELGEALPCEAIVALSRFRFGESEGQAILRGKEILIDHGLGHLVGRLSSRISGGELQRVLITTLVAQEAPVLLVDEPANHLDPSHQVATYRRLGGLYKGGRAVVIVSHDVRLAQMLGNADEIQVLCMKDGTIAKRAQLSDPHLVDILAEIYGVAFVPQGQPGALAIDLERAIDPK